MDYFLYEFMEYSVEDLFQEQTLEVPLLEK